MNSEILIKKNSVFVKVKNNGFRSLKKEISNKGFNKVQIKYFNKLNEEKIHSTKEIKDFQFEDFDILMENENYFLKCYKFEI